MQRHFVYVDNLGIFCDYKEEAEHGVADLMKTFGELGLDLHSQEA